MFGWLKTYMPRGIYARAGLILVLPVLLLQLLVSVVFIQRHFDGVTRLMTSAMTIELRFLVDTANAAGSLDAAMRDVAQLAGPLEIRTAFASTGIAPEDTVPLADLTGTTVIETLRADLPELIAVSLAQRSRVSVWVQSAHGPLLFEFRRSRVSASNPHQLLVWMIVLGAFMTVIAYIYLRNQLRPRIDEPPPAGSPALDPDTIQGDIDGRDVIRGSASLRLFAADDAGGSGLALVRVGLDDETDADGRLVTARSYPAVERIEFPLADPETGGSAEEDEIQASTKATVRVVPFQTGVECPVGRQ